MTSIGWHFLVHLAVGSFAASDRGWCDQWGCLGAFGVFDGVDSFVGGGHRITPLGLWSVEREDIDWVWAHDKGRERGRRSMKGTGRFGRRGKHSTDKYRTDYRIVTYY